MDFHFPPQLFPSFYNSGPPDTVLTHNAGNWGEYHTLIPQGGSGSLSSWTFRSKHQIRGETWRHTEPVTLPLWSPRKAFLWPPKPPDPQDFTEHMENFFTDHSLDAFGNMAEILGENFNFKRRRTKDCGPERVHMGKLKNVLHMLQFKRCPKSYSSTALDAYGSLLWDVVQSVPAGLLGSLLHEELTEQRDRLLFSESSTGGALDFIPSSQSGTGWLLHPGDLGLDRLHFLKVELQQQRGATPVLSSSSSSSSSGDSVQFQLKGPIRQISSASHFDDCCVVVRSDRLCGVWSVGEGSEPRLLEAIDSGDVLTCVSASPHVCGEVLVASESGALTLWTVGSGIQKVRQEDQTLYFNANSPWRWCDFSAHPRVMVYADRTGAELTDMRGSPASGRTLFSIGRSSQCRSGERVLLSRYLREAHSFHHLITTQYSAYIVDERFPGVPMLKWDHMMESPPLFCHIIPGSAPSSSSSASAAAGGSGTTKVLLGSGTSQEITMLQYSGGGAEACVSRGPPQVLLRPSEGLTQLPALIPHLQEAAVTRLSSPAKGLTCIQQEGGGDSGSEQRICVLQLTEAGDVFYQILEPERANAEQSSPPTAEQEPPCGGAPPTPPPTPSCKTPGGEPPSQLRSEILRGAPASPPPPSSPTLAENTSSDEDAIGPTQYPNVPVFVAETPERVRSSDDSDEAEAEGGVRRLKQLQVIVNEGPEPHDEAGAEDGEARRGSESNLTTSCERAASVKLSEDARRTWERWLQELSRDATPSTRRAHFVTVPTERLAQLSKRREPERREVQRLRDDLRTRMSSRSLLVNAALSSPARAPDPAPVPGAEEMEAWQDALSRRLMVSWGGEAAWRAWWDESLGRNREEKTRALRRKRRREKDARRAAGFGPELSDSFTSSMSCQSDLDSFSDSSGWSRSSPGARSHTEDGARLTQENATPPSEEGEGGDQPGTPVSSQRRDRCPVEGAVFTPQDESTQSDLHILEGGGGGGTLQRNQQLDLLWDCSEFSQLPSQSQRSLGGIGLPQSQSSLRGIGLSQSQSSQIQIGLSQSQSPQVWTGLSQSQRPLGGIGLSQSQSSHGGIGLSQSQSPQVRTGLSQSQRSLGGIGLSQSQSSLRGIGLSQSQSSQVRIGLSQSQSPQIRARLSQSQRSLGGIGLSQSQSSHGGIGLTQPPSQSLSSQVRTGLSQSQNPLGRPTSSVKKKSRMGF